MPDRLTPPPQPPAPSSAPAQEGPPITLHFRHAAHQLLTAAHMHLAAYTDQFAPRIHDLLAHLVIKLYDNDLLGDLPLSLGRIVDEATACLLNLAAPQRLTDPADEDLLVRLADLDRLPLPERLRLLAAAKHHTAVPKEERP